MWVMHRAVFIRRKLLYNFVFSFEMGTFILKMMSYNGISFILTGGKNTLKKREKEV